MSKHNIINKVLAYNPDTEETIEDRRVFGSNPPSDLNLNAIKYKWAVSLLEIMEANTWFTSEISLKDDRHTYHKLTKYEREAYDKAFSQVTMMDTFQYANISENILPYCSAPEIRMCLSRQTWEEALHSKSYAEIANTVTPNSNEVFERYKVDNKLRAKNDMIAGMFGELAAQNQTEETMYLSYIANQILEGIFFHSAFATFFSLALAGNMTGTGEMIKLIARDERTHLVLFKRMIRSTQDERPYLYNDSAITQKVMDLIKKSVDLEIEWSNYITSGRVLGLSPEVLSKYIRYLANNIAKGIRYELPYPEITEHPMKWIEDFNSNKSKTNFFEAQVTDYSHGDLTFKW